MSCFDHSSNMETKEVDVVDENEATSLRAPVGAPSLTGSTVKLKRELGLFSAINLILGVMIGSGIFVSPSTALFHAGSVGFCLVVWTVSGVVSFLGALSFAELGTVVAKSGAEYAYFQEAFGGLHKFWGPVPSFICAWVYVVILRPAEVAVIVMTFAEYAIQPFTMSIEAEYKDRVIKLTSLCALGKMEATRSLLEQLALERKELKTSLKQLYNSAPGEVSLSAPTPEQVSEHRQCFTEVLRQTIAEQEVPVRTNRLMNMLELSAMLEERIKETEKLLYYRQGVANDLNAEYGMYKRLITSGNEALRSYNENGRSDQVDIDSDHIARAKLKFLAMKADLHKVISAHFGDSAESLMQILAELINSKTKDDGFIDITDENIGFIRYLKELNIVTINPYDKKKIRLA